MCICGYANFVFHQLFSIFDENKSLFAELHCIPILFSFKTHTHNYICMFRAQTQGNTIKPAHREHFRGKRPNGEESVLPRIEPKTIWSQGERLNPLNHIPPSVMRLGVWCCLIATDTTFFLCWKKHKDVHVSQQCTMIFSPYLHRKWVVLTHREGNRGNHVCQHWCLCVCVCDPSIWNTMMSDHDIISRAVIFTRYGGADSLRVPMFRYKAQIWSQTDFGPPLSVKLVRCGDEDFRCLSSRCN